MNGPPAPQLPPHLEPTSLLGLRVLQSSGQPSQTTNPYLTQLLASLPQNLQVKYFSMLRALFSGYDVFHVHWPEYLVRHRTRLGTAFKQLGAFFLLLKLSATRTPVVRTLHNLQPHEGSNWGERTLLAWLDKLTTVWIRINASTEPRLPTTVTILHGHYRDWFASMPKPASVPGRLLHFGLLRPYKGVETLLATMAKIDEAEVTLRVVGNPASDTIADEVLRACRNDARVSATLRYVEDHELAREIGEAELIVLPYRQMHNSGTLLLALSLARPVLAPWNPANEAIADEVGPGWVYLYRDELNAQVIVETLASVHRRDAGELPDLSARDWSRIGRQHYEAYASAVLAMKGR